MWWGSRRRKRNGKEGDRSCEEVGFRRRGEGRVKKRGGDGGGPVKEEVVMEVGSRGEEAGV